MLRPLFLAALVALIALPATAQPTQDEIADARLRYIDGEYEAALQVLRPAAEAGDANAQNILGDAYDQGRGVEPDPALAVEWWEKAAAQGFSRALHNLGFFYRVRQPDPEKARDWYEQAVALGNAGSMNDLGWMYENGAFGAPDFETAAEYYRRAVAGGETIAMNNLGKLHVYAEGVAEDLGYALDLFRRAAGLGDRVGVKNLGEMYSSGYAVPVDPIAASALFRLAAQMGEADAAIYLAFELAADTNPLHDPAAAWAWCLIGLAGASADEAERFQADCDLLAEGFTPEVMARGEELVQALQP